MIPREIWDRGPAVVNAHIKGLIAKHQLEARDDITPKGGTFLPPAEVIPAQITTAIAFTSAEQGPLDVQEDAASQVLDPEQVELYSRLRGQLGEMLEQIPRQELGSVAEPINDFLAQPANWADLHFKKVLWLCGNSLRNVLSQHDAVSDDPDPHYSKLAPAVAEALRRPVETWNVVVIGDPILCDLDAQRLGPRDRQPTQQQLEKAAPIIEAASEDRRITTSQAGAAIEANLAAASVPSDNIHTQQAKVLARGTFRNLIVQILRGALRAAQDLADPKNEEIANPIRSNIHKRIADLAPLHRRSLDRRGGDHQDRLRARLVQGNRIDRCRIAVRVQLRLP